MGTAVAERERLSQEPSELALVEMVSGIIRREGISVATPRRFSVGSTIPNTYYFRFFDTPTREFYGIESSERTGELLRDAFDFARTRSKALAGNPPESKKVKKAITDSVQTMARNPYFQPVPNRPI